MPASQMVELEVKARVSEQRNHAEGIEESAGKSKEKDRMRRERFCCGTHQYHTNGLMEMELLNAGSPLGPLFYICIFI